MKEGVRGLGVEIGRREIRGLVERELDRVTGRCIREWRVVEPAGRVLLVLDLLFLMGDFVLDLGHVALAGRCSIVVVVLGILLGLFMGVVAILANIMLLVCLGSHGL
jgi:hypothetical protein